MPFQQVINQVLLRDSSTKPVNKEVQSYCDFMEHARCEGSLEEKLAIVVCHILLDMWMRKFLEQCESGSHPYTNVILWCSTGSSIVCDYALQLHIERFQSAHNRSREIGRGMCEFKLHVIDRVIGWRQQCKRY